MEPVSGSAGRSFWERDIAELARLIDRASVAKPQRS